MLRYPIRISKRNIVYVVALPAKRTAYKQEKTSSKRFRPIQEKLLEEAPREPWWNEEWGYFTPLASNYRKENTDKQGTFLNKEKTNRCGSFLRRRPVWNKTRRNFWSRSTCCECCKNHSGNNLKYVILRLLSSTLPPGIKSQEEKLHNISEILILTVEKLFWLGIHLGSTRNCRWYQSGWKHRVLLSLSKNVRM